MTDLQRSFYDLFQARRDQFRQTLAAAPSSDKAAQTVETELDALLRTFASNVSLTTHERSVATFLVDLTKAAMAAWAQASFAEVWHKEPESVRSSPDYNIFVFRAVVGFIEAVLVG